MREVPENQVIYFVRPNVYDFNGVDYLIIPKDRGVIMVHWSRHDMGEKYEWARKERKTTSHIVPYFPILNLSTVAYNHHKGY